MIHPAGVDISWVTTEAQEAEWNRRATAPAGRTLADLRPNLARRALRNISRPSIAPGLLAVQSSMRVLWRCVCGADFTGQVANATKTSVFVCTACRRTGKSRFEFEVAELLKALLATPVVMHHGNAGHQVDLYLPSFDLAVELDPYSSHLRRVESDKRRLEVHRATYPRVVRVREDPLPTIEGSLSVPRKAAAHLWATTIAVFVEPSGGHSLDERARHSALERANAAWEAGLVTPPSPSLADDAVLAAEFVANRTHPGRGPSWIAKGSGDTCLWRCGTCGREWETQVCSRTGRQKSSCPPCAVERRTEAAATAPAGRAVADRAPLLVNEFVENLSRPGFDLGRSFPRSLDRCRWRCSLCSREWEVSINSRYSSGHVGCPPCNQRRSLQARRESDTEKPSACWEAAFKALSAFVSREGHARVPHDHIEGGYPLGSWVHSQRKMRDRIPRARRNRLEALPGWVWNVTEALWERGFSALSVYVDRVGHAAPTVRHIEGGYPVGSWVVQQRTRRESLTADQRRRLEALPGWLWAASRGRRVSLAA